MTDDKITAQFNALIRERDALTSAASAAERERRREEQLLSGHRSAAQQVADQLRVAQSADGEASRKLQNLNDSKVRLGKQIEADRGEIVEVTNELKGKEEEEKRQKWNFVKEMEGINDELDGLLNRQELEKTLRLIDHDTVKWILESKLALMMNRSEGMDETYVEAENEKWREIQSKVEGAAGGLSDAREKADSAVKEKEELEAMLRGLREKFRGLHPNIGQNEIDLLERKWEETDNWGDEYEDDATNQGDVDMVDGEVRKPSEATETAAPVHMDIFYDGQ